MIIYLLHNGQFKSQANGGEYCANNGTKNTFSNTRNNLLSPTPKPEAEFNNLIFLVFIGLTLTECFAELHVYMYSYLIICCI